MVNRLAKLGMLAMAGAELIGCGGPGKHETTPRPGETVEQTDAGTVINADLSKLRTRTVKRVKTVCGSIQSIRGTKKYDCPKLLREYRNPQDRGQKCVDCEHDVEETY